jgi:hypothetical protein
LADFPIQAYESGSYDKGISDFFILPSNREDERHSKVIFAYNFEEATQLVFVHQG